jgi:uncharacterized membrane protein
MWLYYVAIGLTIFANLFYHFSQKYTPSNVNPIVSLIITYAAAIIFCLIVFPFYSGGESLIVAVRKVNWASFTLAIAIVGLELGYLLAYRAGWEISLCALVSNVTFTLIVIPIGFIWMKETLSIVNLIGIFLCIGGLVLVNLK